VPGASVGGVHLSRLSLTDFRSYPAAEVLLERGVTTFTGPNGQGKTNLIEAACYLATFSSHRVATDTPLIRAGADRAILRGLVSAAGRDSLLEIEINAGRANRVRLNKAPASRPREALGVLRCVLFAPEDIAMVKAEPDLRRRYLDDLLVAVRPRYAGTRADYERALKQRNALLKSAKARGVPPSALEVWDEQLVAAGAELTAARIWLVGQLRPLAAECYSAVSGSPADSAMTYRMLAWSCDAEPDADPAGLAAALRSALAARRRAELERGLSLVGPHRDELELQVGGLPARGYASHGESWSMALALRLAAYHLLRSGGDDPVLVLDDVFAELDGERRDRLAGLVADAEQVLVTAAVPGDVPASLSGARFTVGAGQVSRA
jgi:DNA replication and repair protein RecF